MADLDPYVLWTYRAALANGFAVTLWFTAVGVLGGLALGLVLAVASVQRRRAARWPAIAFVELWRNTPLLVQLMWVHFALPLATGVPMTPTGSACLALVCNAGSYFAEILRGGVAAVPRGQWEAGRALGLRGGALWRRVILPQAIRVALPPLVSMAVSVFKGTTILALLSVGEFIQVANRVANFTFKAVEVFTLAAVLYCATAWTLDALARRLEARLRRGAA